jgi:hypothetical protein
MPSLSSVLRTIYASIGDARRGERDETFPGPATFHFLRTSASRANRTSHSRTAVGGRPPNTDVASPDRALAEAALYKWNSDDASTYGIGLTTTAGYAPVSAVGRSAPRLLLSTVCTTGGPRYSVKPASRIAAVHTKIENTMIASQTAV